MTALMVFQLLVFLLAGLGTGAVFLVLLTIGVDTLVSRNNWRLGAAIAVVRLALVAAALWLALQYGPLQMLALFLGFLVARQVWLARVKGT